MLANGPRLIFNVQSDLAALILWLHRFSNKPFFLFYDLTTFVAFSPGEQQQTVLRALVFLCIQDTRPSMRGSQPALSDPKVTAAVAHPCCLYQ